MADGTLPDPRRYGTADAPPGLDYGVPQDLAAHVRAALAAGDSPSLDRLLRGAPSAAAYRAAWEALARGVTEPGEGGVFHHAFALPVILVAGSGRPVTVPAVLPDPGAVTGLLRERGATGAAASLAIAPGLASLDTVEAMTPVALRRWVLTGDGPRDIPPADIEVRPGNEAAHLRFLVGSSITPAGAPTICETASNIGAWGMPMTKLLGAALAAPDTKLLALPRPPKPVLEAAHYGRFAQLEVALHLFVSNTVRRIRMATGDPVAVLAAHDNGDVRLGLHSPFDETLTEGFAWPLHPLDDLPGIERRIATLLADVKITDVRVSRRVWPATVNGATVLVRLEQVAGSSATH